MTFKRRKYRKNRIKIQALRDYIPFELRFRRRLGNSVSLNLMEGFQERRGNTITRSGARKINRVRNW